MIIEVLKMGDYGLYVWSSFGLVIIFCSILYYKTQKKLKKYEKSLVQILDKLPDQEKQQIIKKSKVVNQVLTSNKFI